MRCSGSFECQHCGSPAVSLPKPLNPIGLVRCAGCRAQLATWQNYKATISAALARSGMLLSADPIQLPASAENRPLAVTISLEPAPRSKSRFDSPPTDYSGSNTDVLEKRRSV